MKFKTSTWHDCYSENWRGLITDESFCHPAKMAKGLVRRILIHLKQNYRLKRGDLILDPFGGIGSTGTIAAMQGYRSLLVELEPKFFKMANANFKMHERAWEWAGLHTPVVFQGDSRRLRKIVGPVSVDAIISSPPFLETGTGTNCNRGRNTQAVANSWARAGKEITDLSYGNTQGQLGKMKSGGVDQEQNDTFWSSARTIVQECFALLKTSGVCVWVVKDFVRAKKRISFSDDWRRLCESCGFKTVEWVRASLVKKWTEETFMGEEENSKERKSFFRRLAERKGSPSIDEEDVLFMGKP